MTQLTLASMADMTSTVRARVTAVSYLSAQQRRTSPGNARLTFSPRTSRAGCRRREHLQISRLTAGLAAAIAFSAAAGAVELHEIEEVLVVETRLEDEVFRVGQNTSVESSDLQIILPVDPEQLFQELPGFSVSRPGGPGGVSEVFLRGAESNFTAVYIDGIRLNNPSNTRGGSYDFSMLGIYDVDQLAIAGGAMSAIYGADAMAGAIFIRSAWDRPGESNLFLEAGNAEDWRLGASTSFALGDKTELGVRVSALDGGNDIEGSILRRDSVATRVAGEWEKGGTWEIAARHVQRDRSSFPEVSGGPELAINRELEFSDGDELSVGAASHWAVSGTWTSDLTISSTRIRDNAAVPAVVPGVLDGQPAFSTITRYERGELLWVNSLELSDSLKLVAGINFVKEDGSDDGSVDLGFAVLPNAYQMHRTLSSAFAEIGKQWSNGLTTSFAARWDDTENKGRASGKITVSKTIAGNGGRIWARIADGFKLPSFFALGNPLFGNPDLIAEKVRNVEFGYSYVSDNDNRLSVSLFKSRYDELVDFDFETFRNVNQGRIKVSGVEFRSDFKLATTLRLLADATLLDISSQSGSLRRRPERMGGVSVNWAPAQRWQVRLSARYIGERLITSIPTGDEIAPGFVATGATARFERSPKQVFWVALHDSLGNDSLDAPGFPPPGTQVRIGASLRF